MHLTIFKKKARPHTVSLSSMQGSFLHRMGRDPFLDWSIIIGIFLVITLVSGALALSAYLDTDTKLDQASSVTGSTVSKILNREALDRILGQFDMHVRDRQALLKGYSGLGDPSL